MMPKLKIRLIVLTLAGLVARYGQGYVNWLNGPHEMTNYRREDFIRIRDEYRDKLKALKQREAA